MALKVQFRRIMTTHDHLPYFKQWNVNSNSRQFKNFEMTDP